jgi:hypothetical protein
MSAGEHLLMRRWLPVLIASGASLGVIVAYLIAGGASYQPLAVADPCEPRPPEVLAERGVFEGILLSGLDGAACELGVSREELTAALADPEALDAFSAAYEIDRDRIEAAVRAGLIRAIDDAQEQGRLPAAVASVVRGLAENAPIGSVITLFEMLPGDPNLADVLAALGEAGLTADDLGGELGRRLEEAIESLGGLGGDLSELLPGLQGDLEGALEGLQDIDPGRLPGRDDLERLLPEGVDPGQLERDLRELLP